VLFIQQGHIKLIRSDRKKIRIEISILNKCCLFELYTSKNPEIQILKKYQET